MNIPITAAILVPDESIRHKDLERSLLLMNDLPGVSARSMLEPCQEPGSTRMTVQIVRW